MGVIKFNGLLSTDYGIVVEKPPNYIAAEKECEIVHVPGRNGDVVIEYDSYQNVNRTYEIAVGEVDADFPSLANSVYEWLHSCRGYARLEDDYEPAFYRMAMYQEESTMTNLLAQAGRATINFNCKPQRFLVSGETEVSFSSSGSIVNPTNFYAKPVITVYGSGNGIITVNGYKVEIVNISSYITIDSEIMDAYTGSTNRNSAVTLENGFPKLAPGTNAISFSGGVTSMKIKPNWWTL